MFAANKSSRPRASDGVDLKWLDGKAPSTIPCGTSFGVPWSPGEIDRTTAVAASSSAGSGVPLQTWPLAYWPDGSLKWTGHALSASSSPASSFHVAPGEPTEPDAPVTVSESHDLITVTTGSFSAAFNKYGSILISNLSLEGKIHAQNGKLIVHVQSKPDEPELGGPGPNIAITTGYIETVKVEQDGPVRAVIKVTGKYSGGGHGSFLPFILRFYVSAGATALRVVHFFIYDGNQFKDFIKGIGLTFETPITDEFYNRHVRFVTTDGGIWGEAVRGLSGLRRDATPAVLTPQFEGQAVPDISTWPTTISSELDQLAVWSDFTLDQLVPDKFSIAKRTNASSKAAWMGKAGFGDKSSGVGYVGGANGGGTTFAVKNFWQGAPRGLDIRGAAADVANVTLWAYSPRAPAIDMRHYDTVAHGLDLAYEDVGDPDPNPTGIGRSSEFTIQLHDSTPSRSYLASFAAAHVSTPQIVASPEFYVSHNLFGGRWNVPDYSTTGSKALEQRKSDLLDFYIAEIAQRQWYGFWDYGDVMHTYDQTRHTWRYDVGGYAWDNGELGTDLWLWTSFLRTGRADVFKLAHALTRHISEVDTHHIGTFAGLGSRHNVQHWGDGAKEARVGSSTLKRPFYYLTADELMGDLLDYSLQADQSIVTWEPLRKVLPLPAGLVGRVRIGPDWTTLAGNWFVKWERTNDNKWRDRIKVGMNDIGKFQYGLFTGNGAAVGWDPATAHLTDIGGTGESTYHLSMIFGGGEWLMELADTITDEPQFDAAWVDFCRLYNGTDQQKLDRYGLTFNSGGFAQLYAKLQAYAGQRLNDNALKQAAWDVINSNTVGVWLPIVQVSGTDVVNPINEIQNLTTNDSASLSLSEYAILAIAPELAPDDLAETKMLSILDEDASTLGGSSFEVKPENKLKGECGGSTALSVKLWKKLFCV